MNGETFLIYTTQQGGDYTVHKIEPDAYEQIKDTGEYQYNDGTDVPTSLKPKFVALLRVEDNHDFVLGRSRA